MHKMLLLVDKDFKFLKKSRKDWDKAIQEQIDKYYTFNSLCDSAIVGGRFCKMLECKAGTGLVNPYVGDWDGQYNKEDEIYDPTATKVDVCTIGNMTKPISDEFISYIEFADPSGSTIYPDDPKFKEIIKQINKKEFDGLLVVLDLHV